MRTLNLGILAHVDAGKTTLTERLLFEAGVLDDPGSVDQGSTHTDTMAIERRRGITIRAAVVSFEIDGVVVNLIDTPGHSDFVAEVERSMSLLDGAVLVVSAVEGVQAQTLVLMRALQRLDIATVVFVNKTDRVGADVDFVTLEVRERLSADVPILAVRPSRGRRTGADALARPRLLPVREPCLDGAAAGRVFKIERDDGGAKEVFAHVRDGTLHVRDRVDLGHGPAEKITALRVFTGGRLEVSARAGGGQVAVLRGLESARIGDTFGPGATAGPDVQFARPSLSTVVEAVRPGDVGRLHVALTQLAEQDPLIDLTQDGRRELHLSLYGEVQKEVIGALLAEEYGVEATFRASSVICIERVVGSGRRSRSSPPTPTRSWPPSDFASSRPRSSRGHLRPRGRARLDAGRVLHRGGVRRPLHPGARTLRLADPGLPRVDDALGLLPATEPHARHLRQGDVEHGRRLPQPRPTDPRDRPQRGRDGGLRARAPLRPRGA